MAERYADYDAFAWIYNRYWAGFARSVLPALDELVLKRLPAPAPILDVCCGNGQLAHLLHERGYAVTGVDGSAEMIAYARQNAPECRFVVEDARTFHLPTEYAAALSTFDSLNHILDLTELTEAFRRVYAALLPGGIFVFDVNMEAGYQVRWSGSGGQTADDHAFIQHWTYDADTSIAHIDFTFFFLESDSGLWRRSDLTLTQRAYSEDDLRTALQSAGFTNIVTQDAQELNLARERGGRLFFVAEKSK